MTKHAGQAPRPSPRSFFYGKPADFRTRAYTIGGRVTASLKAHRMSPLITITGLSEITGLAVQTIYNRHSTGGDLPPMLKLGKLVRFRVADVESWINSKVVCPHQTQEKLLVATRIGRPTKAEEIARRRLN